MRLDIWTYRFASEDTEGPARRNPTEIPNPGVAAPNLKAGIPLQRRWKDPQTPAAETQRQSQESL